MIGVRCVLVDKAAALLGADSADASGADNLARLLADGGGGGARADATDTAKRH